jgi:hypothetical protein
MHNGRAEEIRQELVDGARLIAVMRRIAISIERKVIKYLQNDLPSSFTLFCLLTTPYVSLRVEQQSVDYITKSFISSPQRCHHHRSHPSPPHDISPEICLQPQIDSKISFPQDPTHHPPHSLSHLSLDCHVLGYLV